MFPMMRLAMLWSVITLAVVTGFQAAWGEPAQIAIRGRKVRLAGSPPRLHEPAPDFSALDRNFSRVTLRQFRGKTVIISSLPSVDTPVCSAQSRRFYEILRQLPQDVAVLTISMDLPFAQKRFCSLHGLSGERFLLLSDSAHREFATRYGLLIPERGLLARAVMIIDKQGVLRYLQIVPELTSQPDYEAVLRALKQLSAKAE